MDTIHRACHSVFSEIYERDGNDVAKSREAYENGLVQDTPRGRKAAKKKDRQQMKSQRRVPEEVKSKSDSTFELSL